ncbi:MAG: aminopeptidase P family protein [Spirochaetaceae bacterium]|nr:aminopeptidase P family protein [Spirochaetaceae bacterium]
MNKIFEKRRSVLIEEMQKTNIQAVVFHDDENHRNPAVRYYTNHPSDAIFILTKTGKSVLCPWDINIANQKAFVETIIPFTKFDRDEIKAVDGILKKLGIPENSRIEISPETSYLDFLDFVDRLPQYDVSCKKHGLHDFAVEQRMIKDEYEIQCTKKACEITNQIIAIIEKEIKKKKIKTELDVALLIESECRKAGCEKTSFETLAAGPSRSFAIHCFPSYTNGGFAENGLSILDFGVCYEGYASDVTLTIAKGKLSEKQEQMLSLVQEAFDEALKYYKKDIPVRNAAMKVDKIFAKAKMKMPHSLGHGTGLEIHEAPFVRSKASLETVFQPGMIVTLEPGLYDPELGGCRYENDILITESGNEVLTQSRIVRIA